MTVDRYEDLEPDVLHLFFEDGQRIAFSPQEVLERTRCAWEDPEVFPIEVKKAVELEPCEVCPLKDQVDLCHAIFPILHFAQAFDGRRSYERVTLVMRDSETKTLRIQETSVQEAVQPISILSLTNYCELGHKYHELFYGVMPFLTPNELILRLTMNAFWLADGNREAAEARLKSLFEDLDVTIQCQMERIRLVTKSDAFLNSFVRTHILAKLSHVTGAAVVDKAFEAFRASLPQELIPCQLSPEHVFAEQP